jgi:hypothetical protein
MQENTGQGPFPSNIGHVTNAITFNTPHGGTVLPVSLGCVGCLQGTQLTIGSDLLKELGTSGRNPQTSAGFTEWTTIGSQCDIAVQPTSSSVNMDAHNSYVYSGPGKVAPTCYDHGSALKDSATKRNAWYDFCSSLNPSENPCGQKYQSPPWNFTKKGLHSLDLLYVTITGSAARTRPRLWMAATLASAWVLLKGQRS